MSTELSVEALETALMQRASDLATEYRQRAQRSQAHFIDDENERLQLREEREIMAAKILAERIYRSQIQSSQLNVQKKLDQLRWQLIKDVIEQVKLKMAQVKQDKPRYLQWLVQLIQHSATVLDSPHLLVELNATDYQQFAPQWHDLLQTVGSDKIIELSAECHSMSGGLLTYNQQRTMRIDNTFEGRMERLSEAVYRLVAEQFFSELSHEGDKIHAR